MITAKSTAEAIRGRRASNCWTQKQLASKSGLTREMIHYWETAKGIPKIESLALLAEAFEITVEEFILECSDTANKGIWV